MAMMHIAIVPTQVGETEYVYKLNFGPNPWRKPWYSFSGGEHPGLKI